MTLRQVLRYTSRDLRGAPWRSLGVVLSLASAVASVYIAVACLSSFRLFLTGGSRQWLGADLQVNLDRVPLPEDLAALPARMARSTAVIETLVNARSPETGASTPIVLKAVEPGEYPFYGSLTVTPPQPLSTAIAGRQVAVSPELLTALGISPGGLIEINGHRFTAAATILREPDRFAASPYTFNRVVMSRASLEDSGVLRRGNNLNGRLLFGLRDPSTLLEARALLEERFPDADISDYHQPDPRTVQTLDSAGFFLGIGLGLSLLSSFIASALLLHLHLDTHLDTMAILKVLGAGTRQLVLLSAAFTAALAGGACALGLAAGEIVVRVMLPLFEHWFRLQLPPHPLLPALGWSVAACFLAGFLLFVRNSALSIRVRPLRLFRRQFDGRRLLRPGRHLASTISALAAGAALLVLMAILELGLTPALSHALLSPESDLGIVSHPQQQFSDLQAWLAEHPAYPRIERTFPVVRLRLKQVNGQPSLADRMWWANCRDNGTLHAGEAVLSPAQAHALGVDAGAKLDFQLPERSLHVRVVQIEDRNTLIQSLIGIDLACADVSDAHLLKYVTFRVDSTHTPAFRRELSKAFPTLVHISRGDVEELSQELVHHGLLLIRAGFSAVAFSCAWIMVLIAAAEARQRRPETAILRVLGASRRRLMLRALKTYGVGGAIAGALGGATGALGAYLLIARMTHTSTALSVYAPAVIAIPLTSVVAVCAGWFATRRALKVRPMETLREQ
ncbi:FtsX-like permease family protein [Paludibaculum fermentans]|uniref:FtsX-like permease family protein n=1 Tax=Paludibaculum fermentans TaxID=1473598 RepID=UPI003EB87CB8